MDRPLRRIQENWISSKTLTFIDDASSRPKGLPGYKFRPPQISSYETFHRIRNFSPTWISYTNSIDFVYGIWISYTQISTRSTKCGAKIVSGAQNRDGTIDRIRSVVSKGGFRIRKSLISYTIIRLPKSVVYDFSYRGGGTI